MLLVIAGIVVRYFKEIRIAHKRLKNLGSQVIETEFGPIEYARVGEGYPVLVVHGAMGGFDQGLWLAKSFDLTKHQIVSVSRFGYLRSPVPENANLNMQADAYAGLLDALGIQRAAVFGISAGPPLQFSLQHVTQTAYRLLSSLALMHLVKSKCRCHPGSCSTLC